MNTKKKLPAHTKGSGNIFADLGIPNAEQHQLKAALVEALSVEKLLRMLTAFDQDVEITVKPHRKRGEAGRITFIPSA